MFILLTVCYCDQFIVLNYYILFFFALYSFLILNWRAVIGCADPDVTGDVWLKRQSDKAELGCHGNSDITWTLTCGKDGQWTGDSQACPAPGQ